MTWCISSAALIAAVVLSTIGVAALVLLGVGLISKAGSRMKDD